MKKIYTLALALAPLCASAQSMIVTLKSGEIVKYPIENITRLGFEESSVPEPTYVPLSVFTDQALRNAVAEAADADKDDRLSEAEIQAITKLDLASSQVESLEGIQYLTELKELSLQSCTKITEVNIDGILPKLEYLQLGFASNLKKVTLGTRQALKMLYTQYTALEQIDLEGLVALEEVSFASTKLKSIAINNNKNLTYFSAGSDVLESVNLDGCDNIETLSLNNVPLFSGFDIAKFPALKEYSLTYSKVTKVSTENNKELTSLTLNNNESLYTIDVSKSLKLNSLSAISCWELSEVIMTEGQIINNLFGVSDWMIQRVPRVYPDNVADELTNEKFRQAMLNAADADKDGVITEAEAKAITVFNAPNAGLTEVDFTYFPNITEIDLSGNELTSIDLTALINLTKLNLNDNKLTSLDTERNTALEYLYAANNQIATVARFGSSALIDVDLSHNELTTIQLYFKSKLIKANVSYNKLTSADIRNNDNLADFDISHNQLTEMTLWSFSGLVNAKFNDNPFTQLNEANNWIKLETIDCSNTNIPTLNLSQTTVLKKCVSTGCPNLTTIYAGDNKSAEFVKDANTTVLYEAPAQ